MAEKGILRSDVIPTGRDGRIMKEDVLMILLAAYQRPYPLLLPHQYLRVMPHAKSG
jgi:hypothetical protein